MDKFTPQERLRYRLQRLLKKAVFDYRLIEEDDRVLVGLSGGKDSMALVELLGDMSRIARPRFEVMAVHVAMDNIPYRVDPETLEAHCREHNVRFRLESRSFNAEGDHRKSPCFLCSWNRRKALFETAQREGCRKIALAHHRDDFLETLLLNMLYQGSIQAMSPRLDMDKFPVSIIRPLCLIGEDDLKAFARDNAYPPQRNRCPYERESNRDRIRALLQRLDGEIPGVRDSLWGAMQHVNPRYLPSDPKELE